MYKKTAIINGRTIEFINSDKVAIERDIEVVTEAMRRKQEIQNMVANTKDSEKGKKIKAIIKESEKKLAKIEKKYNGDTKRK